MADREVRRRLAAILAADVAGYTRLMEEDSEGTVAAWQDAREDVIKPSVNGHSGKIVKLTGDGFLVEFPTVQDAVNCAIAMQSGLVASKLDFRFGINLGDIIDDGEDIHGEGVNVAARLEGLAEPGGIVISGDVYNQVRNRIEATYEDMGAQDVKNVSNPVQAYAVVSPDAEGLAKQAVILMRPAVAVLPFDNMSGDADQEYFVDGLTEDIITALTAWRSFPVIGRNSTFTFKNRAVKAQDVAAELGARYVLEGSVRKSGSRVRVTAQLLDAETGHHVWAERYDEELIDVFDLQDKMTQQIVAQVAPEMSRAELQKSEIKPPAKLDAWDYYLKGVAEFNAFTPDSGAKAQKMLLRAVELDPTYATAYARLATAYHRDLWLGMTDDHEATASKMMEAAETAVRLDPDNPQSHIYLGLALVWAHNYEQAISEAQQGFRLNPADSRASFSQGAILSSSGRSAEAIPYMESAIKLSPLDPMVTMFTQQLAICYLAAKRYEDAVTAARPLLQKSGHIADSMVNSVRLVLISSYGHLGRAGEARDIFENADIAGLRLETCDGFSQLAVQNNANLKALLFEGLELAGVPQYQPAEAAPAVPSAGKPAIAVLPFDNLSGDADQEFFSDGITEDIITALSRLRWLSVIARNTTFTYKGQAVDVPAIATELDVAYVLEGSVRKAGDKVRITAQLIDGGTGNHIWAEKYDRALEDVFAVQDEITETVSGTVQSELGLSEQSRAKAKPPDSLGVWETYQRGKWHMNSRRSEDVVQARTLFERAIEMDPNFAPSYFGLSLTYTWGTYLSDLEPDLEAAFTAARKAVELDQYDPEAHIALGMAYYVDRDHNLAIPEFELAIDLNPSAAYAHYQMGRSLAMSGNAELSIPHAETAMRLSPKDSAIGPYTASFAATYLFLQQHEEAVTWALKALRYPNISWPVHVVLISALGHLGHLDEADNARDALNQFRPDMTILLAQEKLPITDDGYRDHTIAGLRAAGMAES